MEVVTRDVWSFTPEISYKRAGGRNSYGFGIRDTNILGTGQQVAFIVKQRLDRKTKRYVYKNSNMMGTRVAGSAVFSDSDDGTEQIVSLGLPFYSLATRRSWGVGITEFDRKDPQFFRGREVTEVRHEGEDYRVQLGFSKGVLDGRTRRWSFGYQYRRDRFVAGDELPPPLVFPVDQRLSFPFLGFASIADAYTTAFNFDEILRTEDLHLGHSFFSRFGYAASALGSDADRIVADGNFSDTLYFNRDSWWRHELSWQGLWNLASHKSEDVLIDYSMRYYRNQTRQRSFFTSLNVTYSKNLNTNHQVVFGGNTNARAFDNRFQVGDRRWVLSIEERRFTNFHLFNLVRLGWALFADIGRAWRPGVDSGLADDYLADVGFGLRLSSTKGDAGKIVHIDIARPLTNKDDPSVSATQISVGIKDRF